MERLGKATMWLRPCSCHSRYTGYDFELFQGKIEVEVDQSRLRPVDVPVIEADISKLCECTGWKREISLEQTIEETLDYWRKELT